MGQDCGWFLHYFLTVLQHKCNERVLVEATALSSSDLSSFILQCRHLNVL